MDFSLVPVIIGLLLFFGLSVQISRLMAQRAVCTVIGVFQSHNAVGVNGAQTLKQLGLDKRQLFRLLRDYRPYAFQLLAQNSIIQPTQDGKFFLSQEMLRLADGAGCPAF